MIYADNAATTALAPEAFEAMKPYLLTEYGNASQPYSFSRSARAALAKARQDIAECINAEPPEIYFTSGGTESDNWAIKCLSSGRMALLTSMTEHKAVLRSCAAMERRGYPAAYLPVDRSGIVLPETLERFISDTALLVSVMTANNETGTIQPVAELCRIAHAHGALFHTDAVQAVGAIPLDVEALHADMLSLSAHKFHGPKGIGALYIRKGVKIDPLIHGGAQERGHRAGTENLPGIVGLGKAIELAEEGLAENAARMTFLRNRLISGLTAAIPDMRINGTMDKRLPNNVNVSFAGIEGEAVLLRLDLEGIAASSGSACTAGSLDPSHVLTAIGLTRDEAKGSLRLTLGTDTTQADIDEVVAKLPRIVASLREMTSWCGRG